MKNKEMMRELLSLYSNTEAAVKMVTDAYAQRCAGLGAESVNTEEVLEQALSDVLGVVKVVSVIVDEFKEEERKSQSQDRPRVVGHLG